jgi:hypothetical protein
MQTILEAVKWAGNQTGVEGNRPRAQALAYLQPESRLEKPAAERSAPIAAVSVGRRPARLAWDTIVQVRGRYGITNAAVVGPRSPPNRPRPLLTYYF